MVQDHVFMNNETDNAFRVLQGESKIQSWQCRIGFHRWSIWEYRESNFNIGMPNVALCRCVDCGLPRIERPYSKSKALG